MPKKKKEPLAGLTVRQFIDEVASRSTAPGGGSVAAAMAAMGAGLGSMAAKLTQGVRKFEALDGKMRKIIPPLHEASRALIPMIDADTSAFQDYVEALGLPEGTGEEKKEKQARLQEGLKKAIEAPLAVMTLADGAWDAMVQAARYANIASKSDIEVGAKALEAGIWGAYKNININMAGITDEDYRNRTLSLARDMKKRAEKQSRKVIGILENRKA